MQSFSCTRHRVLFEMFEGFVINDSFVYGVYSCLENVKLDDAFKQAPGDPTWDLDMQQ